MKELKEFYNYAESQLGPENIMSVDIQLLDNDYYYNIAAIVNGRSRAGRGQSMNEAITDLVDIEVAEMALMEE
jgi:hypothetical protein